MIGENTSLETLKIDLLSKQDIYKLDGLLNKFKKINDFEINLPRHKIKDQKKVVKLKINEDQHSQITQFKVSLNGYYNCIFDCAPYERLSDITIETSIIENLETNFPIFNENCNISFKGLNIFVFQSMDLISQNLLKNLYENINCMPNLSKLLIDCSIQENIDKEFYANFIKKCLELKLKNLYFSIKKTADESKIIPYSKEELEEIYPNIKYSKYKEIFIRKLNK
jgi:hypothetical protein